MANLLQTCIEDLKAIGQLVVIDEPVDPNLVMAQMHLKVYAQQGPALYFPKVIGSKYPAVSNLFGTIERSKYMFRKQWKKVEKAIQLRNEPMRALKQPFAYANTLLAAKNALPKKVSWNPNHFEEISISDLPQIKSWPMDGGAFVTLPQVFSIMPGSNNIMHSNLGMYRIQLSGNEYVLNREVGLHYQIHRGLGIHQTAAKAQGKPLKVSVFIGGHPAHTLSAVMPLPEGLSELVFGGMLAGRRFRYAEDPHGNIVSMDADFVITGEIIADEVKPEGPFGDHLGYYSLVHPFPVMKVTKVYARPGAVYPFTVVGRPPQEDTSFGDLIHQLTGETIKFELPGVAEVHAIDAAGVHPLLLAIGSERYTPFINDDVAPAELLTQANHILGFNQLSLAKYLWITAPYEQQDHLSTYNQKAYFQYMLERVNWSRDVHFQTCTTIDTLDYTGKKLNEGSKVVIAAYGPKRRSLAKVLPNVENAHKIAIIADGILAIELPPFTSHELAQREMEELKKVLLQHLDISAWDAYPLIIVCDDAAFVAEHFDNFMWATFTRSNPAHDIYGLEESITFKHWSCKSSLIIDARMKPYMPPVLVADTDAEKEAERLLQKYWKDYHPM